MRTFLRFVCKSREGLRSYLSYTGVVIGSLFVVHLFVLWMLVRERYNDYIDMLFYEIFGAFGAAIWFAKTTGNLLNLSNVGGVSRRTYLKGMAAASPLFALVTALGIQVVYLLTDIIYGAAGNRLGNLATVCSNWYSYRQSWYGDLHLAAKFSPRLIVCNIVLLFALIMFFYMIALVFVGVKRRFNIFAAFVSAGAMGFLYQFMLDEPHSYQVNGVYQSMSISRWIETYIGSWLDTTEAAKALQRYYAMDGMPAGDTFWNSLAIVIAFTLVCYLAVYGIFCLLIRKTPIRGKEQEGAV